MPSKPRVAVTFNPVMGGGAVFSQMSAFEDAGCEITHADYRKIMEPISEKEFIDAYRTVKGREKLFAHAKLNATRLLDGCDCLALSGNQAMVDPLLFNRERETNVPKDYYDFSRTIAELALVHVATQRGMPIMGICGGHQVVAVYGGGAVAPMTEAQLKDHQYMSYDDVILHAESLLHKIMHPRISSQTHFGKTSKQSVYGAHSQAVIELPKNMQKSALGPDGVVIEAAEARFGAPTITTQFHPEVMAKGLVRRKTDTKIGTPEQQRMGKNIFEFFKGAALVYQTKKILLGELKTAQKRIKSKIDQDHQGKTKQDEPKNSTLPWWLSMKTTIPVCVAISTTLFAFFPPAGLALYAALGIGVLVGGMSGILVNRIGTWMRTNAQNMSPKQEDFSSPAGSPANIIKDVPARAWKLEPVSTHQKTSSKKSKEHDESSQQVNHRPR